MPVIPHKTDANTWVIDYVIFDGNKMTTSKVEFKGCLKDALLHERELYKQARQ